MTLTPTELCVFAVVAVICVGGIAQAFYRIGFDAGVEVMRYAYQRKMDEIRNRISEGRRGE